MKKLIFLYLMLLLIPFQQSSADIYLVPARNGVLWGFINQAEEWVIPAQYEEVSPFMYGLASVKQSGKWGYIDKAGNWKIDPAYNKAKAFSDGLAAVKTYDHWGYINMNGNWVIEPRFTAVSSFSDGMAVIYTDDGFNYINRSGNIVFDRTFTFAKPFSEGLASVVEDGHKKFIDLTGNWTILHQYDKADSFSEGFALIYQHGRYGYINNRGDIMIPLKFKDANHFSEGKASVKIEDRWGYIDKTGDLVISAKFEYGGPFKHGYAVVRHYGRYGMINADGEWIINPGYPDLGNMGKTITLAEEVISRVENRIRQWESKGEFEKTSDYIKRVTKESREKEVRVQMQQAINDLAKKYISLEKAELGLYNADAEMFSLFIPGMISTLIPVPISEAMFFRDHWDQVYLRNAEFTIHDDRFVLTHFEAVLGERRYAYDAFKDGVYMSNFKGRPNLGSIEISLPELPVPLEYTAEKARRGEPASDVDLNIPVNLLIQENVFALIIGNEDYHSFQVGVETGMNVDYATSDATIFSEYVNQTLGVPEENITLLINATGGQINQALARMKALARAFDGQAEFIFYYAGHGLPDEETGEPYLIPVDVAASDLTYAIPLEEVYEKFTDYQSGKVTLFIDACFSGGARKESLLAARGIRIRPKSPFVMGNLIVFSASRGEQTAHAYEEKKHGMFTYFLLKKIQETHGYVSLGELAEYLEKEVNRRSLLTNNREQEPVIKVSPILENTWRDLSLIDTGRAMRE